MANPGTCFYTLLNDDVKLFPTATLFGRPEVL